MKDTVNKLDELDRRNFLTGAAASTLGVTILPGLAGAAESQIIKPAAHATAKNVIFLYMSGGMTHVDTFDPKTTGGIAGPSQPASTNADGVQISNLLPELAKQADKFAVVRSMTT
ncbi:MAG: DUF1501 domain-containing protein, partial [Verrucomicrobiota bacterium]|nr:DUF1501 domain-containing protein [Verrucomicrobiota bacterium]